MHEKHGRNEKPLEDCCIVSGKADLFSWNLEEINSAKHCNHSYLNFFTGEKEVFLNVIENLLQTYK